MGFIIETHTHIIETHVREFHHRNPFSYVITEMVVYVHITRTNKSQLTPK